MPVTLFQVDAFTNERFRGNPAGVCLLPAARPEAWMQSVANEMNLAETAFLVPEGAGYRLRWFTPTVEVDLCGHATLASAHVLWEDGHLAAGETARFHTRSGQLLARREDGWIAMDFPAEPAESTEIPPQLAAALGVEPRWVGRNRFDLLVELGDERTVRTLKPDLTMLRAVPVRGVIVTSPAVSERFDFVSRFFAPRVGVDEDPVTGSAHCALAPFWSERFGKESLVGYQVSARGGVVRTRRQGERVVLAGQAVTVMRGELV